MPSSGFRELPLGCPILLSHWLGFCCIWCQRTDLPNAARSPSANSSRSHHSDLSGRWSPAALASTYGQLLANDLQWGRWDLKGTPFFLVTGVRVHCLACRVLEGVKLSGCPFVLVSTVIFPLVTAQLKTNWRFYTGLSKTGFKFTEEFSTEVFNGSLLGLETRGFTGTEHIM